VVPQRAKLAHNANVACVKNASRETPKNASDIMNQNATQCQGLLWRGPEVVAA